MRLNLLCPVFAVPLFALAPLVTAQGQQQDDNADVSLGIALYPQNDPENPVFTSADQSSTSQPFEANSFKMKMDGVEGGWVHPVFSLEIRDQPALSSWGFLSHGNPTTLAGLNWHGATSGNNFTNRPVLLEHFMQRAVGLMMTGGTGTMNPSEVKTWGQPLLTLEYDPLTLLPSERVWRADSPLWSQSQLGQYHRSAWEALLLPQDGEDKDYALFDTLTAIRNLVVEQSVFDTGSFIPAAQFFASPEWTMAVSQRQLAVCIQAIALRAPVIETDRRIDDDDDAPDLSGLPPIPFYGGSRNAKIIILYQELNLGWHDLEDGLLVRNTRVFFDAPHACHDLELRFPNELGGYSFTPAIPWPQRNKPGQYGAYIPNNAVSGEVFARDANTPNFIKVADVLVDAPPSQSGGQ